MLGNSANDVSNMAYDVDIRTAAKAACVPGIFASMQPMPRWLK